MPVSALAPAHSRRESRRHKHFSAFALEKDTVPVLRGWCRLSVPEIRILLENQALITVPGKEWKDEQGH